MSGNVIPRAARVIAALDLEAPLDGSGNNRARFGRD